MSMVQLQQVQYQNQATKILRISDPTEIENVISNFLKGNTFKEERVALKNEQIISIIEKGNFLYPPKITIENSCVHCDGRGFNLKFNFVNSKCQPCRGTGWKIGPCLTCKGTGLLDGESPCYTCYNPKTHTGRGTYLYKKTDKHQGKKCLECNNTGKIKKIVEVNNSKIQEIIWCERCNKRGISNELGERVLSPHVAEMLKKKLMEKHKQTKIHLVV